MSFDIPALLHILLHMDASLLSAFIVLGGVALMLIVAIAVVAVMLKGNPRSAGNLAGAVQRVQEQNAALAEKLARLDSIASSVTSFQVELRGLAEKVSEIDKSQNQTRQSLVELRAHLAQTGATTRGLVEATSTIQSELSRAREDLTRLHAQAVERREVERRTAESIRRLETIIAGTQTKGAAGENILEVVFAKLPPEWQVRNFTVQNKTVEFGLRLPNGLILPVDSKWTATHLLEQLAAVDDPDEQQRIKAQIEKAVLDKAREVRKYIDPNLTVDFGVAAVPDAIYDLCAGILPEIFALKVVLLSYSMFMPYLLLVFHTILKSSRRIDLERLDTHLQNVQTSIEAVQQELEGRFSRALTMLDNSRNDMRVQLGKANGSLTALLDSANVAPVLPEDEAQQSFALSV